MERRLPRRDVLAGVAAMLAFPHAAAAQSGSTPFAQWVVGFRARALARGISAATYDRVMSGVKPDTTVFGEIRNQPEFKEEL